MWKTLEAEETGGLEKGAEEGCEEEGGEKEEEEIGKNLNQTKNL